MKRLLWLLVFLVPMAAAQSTAGNWYVGLSDEGAPYMFTSNDSGNYLGKWCDLDEGSCYWMMLTKTQCNSGASAPVLLNLGTGATTTTNSCAGERLLGKDKVYRHVLHRPDELDKYFTENEEVAIAIALEGGTFRVLRFKLAHGADALHRWEALLSTVKPKKNTRDKTL